MSSISAQGVVERASAELSKRINGLGLRSKHHHGHAKTSVMERVTNALCGGSSHHNASIGAPEKPSRMTGSGKQMSSGKLSSSNSQQNTPLLLRKLHSASNMGHGGVGPLIGIGSPLNNYYYAHITTMTQLLMDERYLERLFEYFSPVERCILAQVCVIWRDVLYRNHRFWRDIMPVLPCREFRQLPNHERIRYYSSMLRRGIRRICLVGASDEDALDVVHSFPLAPKHIYGFTLRCSSVSDRGLEAVLDHLQVSRLTHFL